MIEDHRTNLSVDLSIELAVEDFSGGEDEPVLSWLEIIDLT